MVSPNPLPVNDLSLPDAARDVTGATSSRTPRAYTQAMQERAAIWPRTLEDKAVLEDCDMSDELLETLPLIAVLIEVAVFGWAFLRKNVSGVVLVNAIGAAAVIALIAPELKVSLQFVDVFFVLQVVIVAFALATLTTSFSWLIHPTGRSLAVWAEFSVLVGLSATLAIFFAVLQMARLG
jgi:hypothetical protein